MKSTLTRQRTRRIDLCLIAALTLLLLSAILLDLFFDFFTGMEAGELIVSPYWSLGFAFWTVLYLAFFLRIFCAPFSGKEKWQLVSYIILPSVIFSLFELLWISGHTNLLGSVACFGAVISMYLIFFNQYHERGRKLLLKEVELAQIRLNTMVLQANPHLCFGCKELRQLF